MQLSLLAAHLILHVLLLLGPAYFFGTCLIQTPGQDWLLQTWKSENRWGVQPSSLGWLCPNLEVQNVYKHFTTFKG